MRRMPGVGRRIICKYGLLKQKLSANMAALLVHPHYLQMGFEAKNHDPT